MRLYPEAGETSVMPRLLRAWGCLAIAVVPMLCFGGPGMYRESETNLAAVYSRDPQDSWNRIFRALFTRTVTARLTNEYADGAPYNGTAGFQHIPISKKAVERQESGDHAIEPLYPSFLNLAGPHQVLTGPHYSDLKQALQDALAEQGQRSRLSCALMQADAWAAYDILFRYPLCRACGGGMQARTPDQWLAAERREELLILLAKFLQKLALTPARIRSLPRNYAAGGAELPPVFDTGSEWMEVEWAPERAHDADAGYRRAARVFVKPVAPPADREAFVNSLREPGDVTKKLDAMALVIEDLLLDNEGNVVPSPITYDVQVRTFVRDAAGKFLRVEVAEHELNRQRMLSDAKSSLAHVRPDAPAYLSASGNDYGFATPQIGPGRNSPVLGTLDSRCASCHFTGAGAVFTFSAIFPRKRPAAKTLPVDKDLRASFVAQRKMQREDYKSLRAAWGRKWPQR